MFQGTLFDTGEPPCQFRKRQPSETESRLAYSAALAEAIGNGADWEYRGECTDMGPQPRPNIRCACGHPNLRFLFKLHHKRDGREIIVGSSCVDHYPGISPELVERLKGEVSAILREHREREQRARELSREAEISAALAEYNQLAWELNALVASMRDGSVPYSLWRYFGSAYGARLRRDSRMDGAPYPRRWKAYKARHAFLRVIREEIAFLRGLPTRQEHRD